MHQPQPFQKRASRGIRFRVGTAALAVVTISAGCQATTNSNRVDVTLQATLAQSITLAVAVPTVVFGPLTQGISNLAPVGQALTITSTWNLNAGQNVKLYAYFDSASSAMTGVAVGDVIPASAVSASVNGAASQSFTQTSPFSTGSTATQLYSVAISAGNAITAARVDTMALSLNLTGMNLHADTYTGTMHLQAQAL